MLIINGKEVNCDVEVRNWHQHKMEFKPGRGARKRISPIDLFVLHWTGGEGNAEAVYRVLNGRGLGIEFVIDTDGMIWQFCDPIFIDTFDAGNVNHRSIGVEIVSYGFRTKATDVPGKGRFRNHSREKINGSTINAAQFNDKQLKALQALLKAVCGAIDTLPYVLPYDASNSLITSAMTNQQLADHKGIIGHYHITNKKLDPGLHIFKWLKENP